MVQQAETVTFGVGAAIDRDSFVIVATLARVPDVTSEIGQLVKRLETLSKVKGAVEVGIKALELLDIIESDQDRLNAKFAEVHQHLDQVAFALQIDEVIRDRDARLATMRTATNVTQRIGRDSAGAIDGSMLSELDAEELGNALWNSQVAAQTAGMPSAFSHYFDESVTAGIWKNYITQRPGKNSPQKELGLVKQPENTVFDWRWGIMEYLHLISARIAIIAITDSDFRNTGEYDLEIGQYRARLSALYDQMADGVRCAGWDGSSVDVVCADIYTGLTTKTTFQNSRCFGTTYNETECYKLIDQHKVRNRRVLMTYMPLFEVRAAIDSLTVILNGGPDLTEVSHNIRLRDTPPEKRCLGQVQMTELDTDPYVPTPIPGHFWTEMVPCADTSMQRWFYDRRARSIVNEGGSCLGFRQDDLNDPLEVRPCSGRRSERWTYDPDSGTLENAFYAVASGPTQLNPWEPGLPYPHADLRRGAANQEWESSATAAFFDPFGDAPTTVFVGTDPNWFDTQWIGWEKWPTGECHWDFIGDGSGLPSDVHVRGRGGDDWIMTVPPGGTTFCGYFLTPPITNGNKLYLEGGKGHDLIRMEGAIAGSSIGVGGEGDDALIVHSTSGEPRAAGGPGSDRVHVYGSGQGLFSGDEGNDCLSIEGDFDGGALCGPGSDAWSGPGLKPVDCESVATGCN